MKKEPHLTPQTPPRTPAEIKVLSVLETVAEAIVNGSQPDEKEANKAVLAEIRAMKKGARAA